MKRKRPKLPQCKSRGCKRRPVLGGFCKTHATRRADKAFSERVRETNRCMGVDEFFWQGPKFECSQVRHCAHLISRRYRMTRWDEDNAVCLCAGHHKWFDTHPLEKDEMAKAHLGETKWQELKTKAMTLGDWSKELMKWL